MKKIVILILVVLMVMSVVSAYDELSCDSSSVTDPYTGDSGYLSVSDGFELDGFEFVVVY